MQDDDQAAPSRSPDGALKNTKQGCVYIAQFISGIDNTILYILVAFIIILIPTALFLQKTLKARFEEEEHARRQRLDYQPSVKHIPVTKPVPISWQGRKQQPAFTSEINILEKGQNLQQCLLAIAEKYSLDSFTIATSDGLVLASSIGDTAAEDAARYGRNYDGTVPEGVTLFSLTHKGSELTGIIRSEHNRTGGFQKRIENDTKDILNKWI